MAMTVLEQIKKLDEQRAKLLLDATTETRAKVDAAITELNSLGYNYFLAEHDKAPKKKTQREKDPTKPCSVCGFVTVPIHDARQHRAQGDKKRPFNAKELEELGLKKA